MKLSNVYLVVSSCKLSGKLLHQLGPRAILFVSYKLVSRILQASFTGRGDPEAAIGGDLSLDDILVGLSKLYIFLKFPF